MFLLVLALASLGLTGPQTPAPQQPPAAQPTEGQVVFTGDAAIVLNYIKSDKAADFETVMAKVKEALERSPIPARKQQAAGWRIFKSTDAAGEGQVLYVWIIDPVVKGADYSVPKIVSEVFPTEARTLYDRYLAAFGRGQVRINGTLVTAMGQ
jgi:hypothetical protein